MKQDTPRPNISDLGQAEKERQVLSTLAWSQPLPLETATVEKKKQLNIPKISLKMSESLVKT